MMLVNPLAHSRTFDPLAFSFPFAGVAQIARRAIRVYGYGICRGIANKRACVAAQANRMTQSLSLPR
jgi:hypothetical protein